MPIYVYSCSECNHSRELMLRSHKDTKFSIDCPKCDSLMYRNFQDELPNFVLSGGGWGDSGYIWSNRECMAENDKMMKEDDISAKQQARKDAKLKRSEGE